MPLIEQAAQFQGFGFDASPFLQDGGSAAEAGVGGCDVAEALMASDMVVVVDESADSLLQSAGEIVVLQQDAVLQGLMPALDLALRLGWFGAPRTWSMP